MKFVVTDYHAGGHCPYTNVLRRSPVGRVDDDEPFSDGKAVEAAIEAAGAVDGDEIEIVVRKTGRRPFGDRKVKYVAPHTYEREK